MFAERVSGRFEQRINEVSFTFGSLRNRENRAPQKQNVSETKSLRQVRRSIWKRPRDHKPPEPPGTKEVMGDEDHDVNSESHKLRLHKLLQCLVAHSLDSGFWCYQSPCSTQRVNILNKHHFFQPKRQETYKTPHTSNMTEIRILRLNTFMSPEVSSCGGQGTVKLQLTIE